MTAPTSQSYTFTAEGSVEDWSQIIRNIDPDNTYLLTNLEEDEDAIDLTKIWMTDSLQPPQQNAHPEKVDFTSVESAPRVRLENYCQHVLSSVFVTDAQEKRKKQGVESEIDYQKEKLFRQHANDIELALMKNSTQNLAASNSDSNLLGGIPFFMQRNSKTCTFAADTDIVTCANHGFRTGMFVMFTSTETLPAVITADEMYFINKVDDNSFKIFPTIEDAVKNTNVINIADVGTGDHSVYLENIVDCGNTAYTTDHVNYAMEYAFNRGGRPDTAIVSGRNKRRFSTFVPTGNQKNRNQKEKEMQEVTDTYITDFGTIDLTAHRLQNNTRIDILEMQHWGISWFDRTHEPDNIAKKGTYTEAFIESWVTLMCRAPLANCALTNIKPTRG
ncbi:hypothetical protein SOV_22880 [Sporomusa ovata DSM 2662]|uniref:Uncharacterized protein n=1 Tax=Sporomusa ovata TaxID=2378 RepID=A0A0U1L394_9FIRM|nr:DUF5309 family protein [Sporomusa ovata]EQB25604.1 hypothetical protein SOV_4c02670 [Sporomusa ovata DSM 2662]CQR74162.1 hypothetical protein SpAn4DRAFT_0624 [Sporomusa ovata]